MNKQRTVYNHRSLRSCHKLGLWLAAAWLFAVVALCSSCKGDNPSDAIEQGARQFAEAYFNLQFKKAAQWTTPGSRQWLEFRASNITEADIEVYNAQQQTATCEVEDIRQMDDTTALVTIKMHNLLAADSIGTVASIKDEATYELTLKGHDTQWQVQLDAPLFEKCH